MHGQTTIVEDEELPYDFLESKLTETLYVVDAQTRQPIPTASAFLVGEGSRTIRWKSADEHGWIHIAKENARKAFPQIGIVAPGYAPRSHMDTNSPYAVIELRRARTLAVTVNDARGNKLPNATLRWRTCGLPWSEVDSNSLGIATIPGAPHSLNEVEFQGARISSIGSSPGLDGEVYLDPALPPPNARSDPLTETTVRLSSVPRDFAEVQAWEIANGTAEAIPLSVGQFRTEDGLDVCDYIGEPLRLRNRDAKIRVEGVWNGPGERRRLIRTLGAEGRLVFAWPRPYKVIVKTGRGLDGRYLASLRAVNDTIEITSAPSILITERGAPAVLHTYDPGALDLLVRDANSGQLVFRETVHFTQDSKTKGVRAVKPGGQRLRVRFPAPLEGQFLVSVETGGMRIASKSSSKGNLVELTCTHGLQGRWAQVRCQTASANVVYFPQHVFLDNQEVLDLTWPATSVTLSFRANAALRENVVLFIQGRVLEVSPEHGLSIRGLASGDHWAVVASPGFRSRRVRFRLAPFQDPTTFELALSPIGD